MAQKWLKNVENVIISINDNIKSNENFKILQ